jgi:hypothetical protein
MMTTPSENDPSVSSESEHIIDVAPDLTDEEQATLNRLREAAKRRNQIPPEQRIPITNPEKYSFPVGMDDQGNLNTVRDAEAE